MKKLIMILLIGILVSCQSKQKNLETIVFSFPEIKNSKIDNSTKAKIIEVKNVSEVFPTFAGKFKFSDTIDINGAFRDTTESKDVLTGISRFHVRDSIDVNGFELIVDYENTILYNRDFDFESVLYKHYPVYFVNSTNTDKVFFGRSRYTYGIQEAAYKKHGGIWRPIEASGRTFCGNGDNWGLIVHPQEFVLILMRKYEGNYETKLRARFKIGENILVSRPFIGRINEGQFSIKDSSDIKIQLQKTDGKAAEGLFYGAVPDEEQWTGKAF